jgi:hypothetical protein
MASPTDIGYFTDADQLDDVLKGKERRQSSDQAYAHELCDYWINTTKTVYWPTLSKKAVREGLHARIDNPDLIKQGPTGLCGPAGFLRALSYDDPCEFAKFGAIIFSGGWYNLGKGRKGLKMIKPSDATRMSEVPPGMDHADWLILASLRDAFNSVFDYKWDWKNQMTGMSVHSVADFFKAAGYSTVVENLGGAGLFAGSVSKGYDNIEKANAYFLKGFAVVILIDADLLKTATPGTSMVANHWIALRSTIDVNRFWKKPSGNQSSQIGIQIPEVWSWGDKKRVPPYPDGKSSGDFYMAFEDFCKCYYGFVAAKA